MARGHIRNTLLFASILGIVLGCSPSYRIVLKGSEYPPRPPDCAIHYKDIDPDKAAVTYQQIGLISLDGFDGELTEGIREELSTRACQMGGEIVVPMEADYGVEGATTSFLVLTSKTEKAK